MKIVVPYTKVHPTTRAVLKSYNLKVNYHKLEDDDAYRRLFQRLWHEGDPFIIIEHDIVPWPGAIEELWECPCHWGAYSYRCLGGVGLFHMFGCTKITEHVISNVPHVWDEPEHWSSLDAKLFHAARAEGIEPHPHRPPVIHLSKRELSWPKRS